MTPKVPENIFWCPIHQTFYDKYGKEMSRSFWSYWKAHTNQFPLWLFNLELTPNVKETS